MEFDYAFNKGRRKKLTIYHLVVFKNDTYSVLVDNFGRAHTYNSYSAVLKAYREIRSVCNEPNLVNGIQIMKGSATYSERMY